MEEICAGSEVNTFYTGNQATSSQGTKSPVSYLLSVEFGIDPVIPVNIQKIKTPIPVE